MPTRPERERERERGLNEIRVWGGGARAHEKDIEDSPPPFTPSLLGPSGHGPEGGPWTERGRDREACPE